MGWLSAIGGYTSGNGYVWQVVDPVCQQHLDTQGTQDMMRLNKFIKSLEWWKLVPSGLNGMKNIIADPDNIDTSVSYISAAAARDGSVLVAYIPPDHTAEVKVDLSALSKPGFVYWIEPTDGRYIPEGTSSVKNTGLKEFIHPGKNHMGESDWVLLLRTSRIGN